MYARSRTGAAIAVSFLAAALVAGCQSSQPEAEATAEADVPAQAATPAASVDAGDQAAGASVTVASVTMPVTGFVTIHASNPDGSMVAPDSIGHVAVPAGTSANVVVPLDAPASAGDVVHVMLHEDTGEPGVYEFRAGATEFDLPVIVDGAPVVAMVTLQ